MGRVRGRQDSYSFNVTAGPICRVLAAEDHKNQRRALVSALAQQGAEVSVVGNGRRCVDQALRALEGGMPYDVVLVDARMPGLDGYSVAALLRENGFRGVIVSMSSKALACEQSNSSLAGCDMHVSKREITEGKFYCPGLIAQAA